MIGQLAIVLVLGELTYLAWVMTIFREWSPIWLHLGAVATVIAALPHWTRSR